MEISNARREMYRLKEVYLQQEQEVVVRKIDTPNFCSHAGSRMRYDEACERYVVAIIEHRVLRRKRLLTAGDPVTLLNELENCRKRLKSTQFSLSQRRNETDFERLTNTGLLSHNELRIEGQQRFERMHLLAKSKKESRNKKEAQLRILSRIKEENHIKDGKDRL